jgi:hypothetical protein
MRMSMFWCTPQSWSEVRGKRNALLFPHTPPHELVSADLQCRDDVLELLISTCALSGSVITGRTMHQQ